MTASGASNPGFEEAIGRRLEEVIDAVMLTRIQSPKRLVAMADYIKERLAAHGLPEEGTFGGSDGELKVRGFARIKSWDIAYQFADKYRLLVSLKSIQKNPSGSIPNRLDDLMGEVANVQQEHPEIVIGYVILFDVSIDQMSRDGSMWSDFLESALKKITIREAPLWNQGLLEASWFVRFNREMAKGQRIRDIQRTIEEGEAFVQALVTKLKRREPAIPFQAGLSSDL